MFKYRNLFLSVGLVSVLSVGCKEETKNIQKEKPVKTEKKLALKEEETPNKIVHYEFEEGNEQEFLLPLYGVNYVKGEFILTNVVEDFVKIKKGTPISEVAKKIAAHVSKKMKGLKLSAEVEELEGGVKCLNIKLIEPDDFDQFMDHSWAQSFSASGVAKQTLAIIVPNFLQKDYKGPWIDVIRFEDEGDGITKHEYKRYERKYERLN
ncbi:hypothetical protein [Aureivirga marina]|uniref:hypothetical protein n=1 Tax=Aureivirga marina TaxID=1182451 RepID=UPI0018CA51AC|nr:hypothetical protein [Aureivirga marina]